MDEQKSNSNISPDGIAKIKTLIRNAIQESYGIKATELISAVLPKCIAIASLPDVDLVSLINEMVTDKEIVELEVILPSCNYRVKSMYFPAGTGISVVGV